MKEKLLIFIDWFSPGYKAGGPTTSNVNIVDHLHPFFDIWVITSDKDYNSSEPYEGIPSNQWIEAPNCHIYYFNRDFLSLTKMKSVAATVNADVWYVNGIYSKHFSIYPLIIAKRLTPSRLIVSARGMLSPHALAVRPAFKRIFISLAKFFWLYSGVVFHGTTKQECADIKRAISNNVQCVSIENLSRKVSAQYHTSMKRQGCIRLVSFARISSEKNTLFAIKALAGCKSTVNYDIYGQINSPEYWEDCLRAISKLPNNVTVNYRGTLPPHLLNETYHKYDVMYLPTTGENFGHAILESFINGRPVVISNCTPWRDLAGKGIGFDIPLKNVEEFAAKIDAIAEYDTAYFDTVCSKCYEYGRTISLNAKAIEKYRALFSVKNNIS